MVSSKETEERDGGGGGVSGGGGGGAGRPAGRQTQSRLYREADIQ